MRIFVTASQSLDPPEWIKLALGAIVGGLASLLGGWDLPLYLLAIAQIADVCFGIAAGTMTEGFSPRKLSRGVAIKVGYWGVVVIAVAVDQALIYYGLDAKMMVHEAAVVSFFVADSVSALANAAICGVPVPPQILAGLAKFKEMASEVNHG